MAFGILEDHRDPQPLGTALLEDIHSRNASSLSTAETILIPAPSDSPDDPLNFSRAKKEVLFFAVMLGTCGTASIGPLFIPGFHVLAVYFDQPLQRISLLNGCLIITLGVSAYVCGSLAQTYGKRLILLSNSIIVVVTACWAASAKSYGSLLGARIIQGFGMGGFFSLAGSAVINDAFFVHQRATRVGIWTVSIVSATNLTPIITGYVIANLSWRWTFWLLAIVFGVILVVTYLFLPETKFNRTYDDLAMDISAKKPALPSVEHEEIDESSVEPKQMSIPQTPATGSPRVSSRYIDPTPKSSSLWRRLLRIEKLEFGPANRIIPELTRPLLFLLHPCLLWSSATWALTFGWGILTGLVASQIWGGPPYNMSPSAVGNLVGIAPLIGSILSPPIAGWLSDHLCEWLATRNNGVFEPEFRLPLLIPFTIIMAAGSFGLGAAVENALSPIICGVFLALINFAIGIGATVCISYSNEVAQHRAGEALGVAMLVKSAYAFGMSFAVNDYFVRVGALRLFSTFGALNIGLGLLGGVLWVWGKRCRAWSARRGILGKVSAGLATR